ncbi:hypothetical protein RZN25_01350 [Bacillaceae bacterium S4-13-56]
MRIGVDHCFSRVSFHMVNRLLDHGYEVQGRGEVKSKDQEDMYMWIGRNANFDWITVSSDFSVDQTFLIEEVDETDRGHSYYRMELLHSSSPQKTFYLPFLYGPWLESEDWTWNDQYQILFPQRGESWVRENGIWVEDACDWVISSLSQKVKQKELVLLPRSYSKRECHPNNSQFLVRQTSFDNAIQKWKMFKKY